MKHYPEIEPSAISSDLLACASHIGDAHHGREVIVPESSRVFILVW